MDDGEFRQALARMDRAIERSAAAIERSDRSYEVMTHAFRQFIRAEHRRERTSREVLGEMQDQREQIRANTRAVLAMLDRLGPAPG